MNLSSFTGKARAFIESICTQKLGVEGTLPQQNLSTKTLPKLNREQVVLVVCPVEKLRLQLIAELSHHLSNVRTVLSSPLDAVKLKKIAQQQFDLGALIEDQDSMPDLDRPKLLILDINQISNPHLTGLVSLTKRINAGFFVIPVTGMNNSPNELVINSLAGMLVDGHLDYCGASVRESKIREGRVQTIASKIAPDLTMPRYRPLTLPEESSNPA